MATTAQKIDSNLVGLTIAEEVIGAIGTLPGTPVWIPLDPNDYSNFGGKIKLVARNPINASRQRKKGVVVDLDAQGEFGIDLTQTNMQSLMQGFLFADLRTKNELAVAAVDGAGEAFQPLSGGAGYTANDLLFAKGSNLASNNGLMLVSGVPTGTSVVVTSNLTTEAGAAITISRVGIQFGATVASITSTGGSKPTLQVSGNAKGTSTLTGAGQPANGDIVTIGSKTYTFQSVLTNVDGNVAIGGSLLLSLANLANAINLNGTGVPGTDYALATTQNTQVTAVAGATTVVVTSIKSGTAYNSVATTKTSVNLSWGTATLTGGTGRSLLDLGLIPGEWVCLGDDSAAFQFATAANNGLKRLRIVADSSLTFDKSTLLMVTDAGTAKTIRVFFARLVKNESTPTLIKRRTYQLERTLGANDPVNNPTQIQSEYLIGSIPAKFELDVKQGDKVVCKASYQSSDYQQRSGATGVKAGTRPALADANAFNATSHVIRLSLAAIDQTTATPVDLFAFLMDLKLTIDNGLKPNKAVKYLGSFDHSAGNILVSASTTAYFTDVASITAVRSNVDATMDFTFGQANQGVTFDMPLLALGDALANVKQDEAIMIPLTGDAASGVKNDTNFNHTVLVQFWDYLPTLAA
jgi:hypothetical protein